MGIYTDIATDGKQFPVAPPTVGLDRSSRQQVLAALGQNDTAISAAFASTNEVDIIPEQVNAGVADTYVLTFQLYASFNGQTVVTLDIAYDAVDSVIEAAIDAAMTAAGVLGWLNGDVSVTMAGAAGLDDGEVTLTFDGNSLNATPVLTTLTPTGFTATLPINRTGGHDDRKALQALYELNVVSGTIPLSPFPPTDWVRPGSNGQSRPRYELIRDLALLAVAEDGTDFIYNAVAALYPGLRNGS